ncbi:thiol reductant ABC exporter subunit CydD [Psychromicrobium lacuslunae]|uniref:thiol reductant ABC exporter subunit CydD n=1 Tax=Psychromicrobium lacuslunae TaxID=1618207 RepID=UPI0006961697|nr:thiol reductant ABC exporter subunit CydD [Psychromicrobium lacuslunae]
MSGQAKMKSKVSPQRRAVRNPMGIALPAGTLPKLYLLGLLGALKATAMVIFADGLARASVAVFNGQLPTGWIALAALAALLRALVVWGIQVLAQRAALGAKEALRAELVQRWMHHGGAQGSSPVLATRGLDALDGYYTQFLPALVSAVTVPLIIGIRILSADWVSALIIVLTVPLIPLFMALIGWHTQDKVAESAGALLRLSQHLVELARGLPVLVGLGRSAAQRAALKELGEQYRSGTMRTLRTAFLSALALELIATLSVAVVAVFVGVRLVYGQLGLETGLLVLILVADCYLPLREVGSAFHASDDGREAMRRAQLVLDEPPRRSLLEEPGSAESPAHGEPREQRPVRVKDLSVQFPGRREATISGLSFEVKRHSVCAISGPSGCGKSTVLNVLAGQLTAATERAEAEEVEEVEEPEQLLLSGSVTGVDPERLAWLPQQARSTESTVAAELQLWGARDITGLLERVGLSGSSAQHPATLSPGQFRRLALARVLARVEQGAELVLADEPTAHVDQKSARLIEEALIGLRDRATVLLVSHDPVLLGWADQQVRLAERR